MTNDVKATLITVGSIILTGKVATVENVRRALKRNIDADLLWLVQAGMLRQREASLVLTLHGCITCAALISSR